MTSLAHFEKVARAIETPHFVVIDGRLQPRMTGRAFDNVTPRNGTVINRVAECGTASSNPALAGTVRFTHFINMLNKYADLKSVSITIR